MNEKFFDLKKEKQDSIINAALKIFSATPYQYASTDEIVKEAGISKGLLFHYFHTKAEAYEFMYNYSVRFMLLEMTTRIDEKEDNYFELCKQVALVHYQVNRIYPYLTSFLHRAEEEKNDEIIKKIQKKKKELRIAYERVFQKAKTDMFQEESTKEQLIKITEYVLDGLNRDYFGKLEKRSKELYQEKVQFLSVIQTMTINKKANQE